MRAITAVVFSLALAAGLLLAGASAARACTGEWTSKCCPGKRDEITNVCHEWCFYCEDEQRQVFCVCPAGHYCGWSGPYSYECYPVGSPGPSAPPGGGGACWIDVADNLRVNWSHSPSKVRFSWEQTGPLFESGRPVEPARAR